MTPRTILNLLLLFITAQTTIFSQPLMNSAETRNDDLIYSNYENTCERDLVIQAYEDEYLVTAVSTEELAWTGNVDNCSEGKISEMAMNRTRDRINYFRRLVGIPNGIFFAEEKNKKCQKAALMMDAENKLDHYPTEDWLCASDDGIQAAGKSNLSYGGHSSASIPQYIRDAGTNNGAVGHRRWILYPRANEFGFGSTNSSTAMWVIGGNQSPETYPEFVAYPSPGYFPKPLLYPRWSFSKKGANFNNAKVSIQDEKGRTIALVVEEVVNGFGDNTLVWVPEINLFDNVDGSDHYFKVTIDSITVSGEQMSYNYEVVAIDMARTEPLLSMSAPSCNDESGSISLEMATGYKAIEWSTGQVNQSSIGNLSAGEYSVSITDKLGCTSVYNIDLEDQKEPKVLAEVNGNSNATSGAIEKYSVSTFDNGSYEWSVIGGTISENATTSEVEVTWGNEASSGTICVKFVENEGCQSNEVCKEVDLTLSSTTDIVSADFIVAPNPTSSRLTIQTNSQFFDQVIITDLSGRIVLQEKFAKTQVQNINVSNFLPGIYLLKVKTDSGFAVAKIVKK